MTINDFSQYTAAVTSVFISQVREVLFEYGLLLQNKVDDFVVVDDTGTVDHLDGCPVVVLPRGFGGTDGDR